MTKAKQTRTQQQMMQNLEDIDLSESFKFYMAYSKSEVVRQVLSLSAFVNVQQQTIKYTKEQLDEKTNEVKALKSLYRETTNAQQYAELAQARAEKEKHDLQKEVRELKEEVYRQKRLKVAMMQEFDARTDNINRHSNSSGRMALYDLYTSLRKVGDVEWLHETPDEM